MPIYTATLALGSVSRLLFITSDASSSSSNTCSVSSCFLNHSNFPKQSHKSVSKKRTSLVCAASKTEVQDSSPSTEQARRSADWKVAKAYSDSGFIFDGMVEGYNSGGLLVRFHSLVGFLPFPQLSPSHFCQEPGKGVQEIAKGLLGSLISVKVIQADEENKKLIFSEKEAVWSKFSEKISVGDVFEARVGSVEDYGAFVHLLFPDGLYHLTGLVHVSEVSWDLVQDVRDILSEGDAVRVKIINIDREKSRITLSIKQLEEDPLLETLDKVIPQDGSDGPDSLNPNNSNNIEPLPGLEAIFEELLQEQGIDDVGITRQGFEKRVVSQDLQLWLSNSPAINQKFTLLARAGRQDVIARYESHIENVGKLDRPSLELEHDCVRLSKELANKSRNIRQLNGEDLEGLNIDELQRLEKDIEGCLNRVNQTKEEKFSSEVLVLEAKGAELMEATNQLRQDIGMLSNGSVTFESDISTAEEGWLSESATNTSSCLSTDSSLDDHSGTDTLSLKLGLPYGG